MRQPNASRCNRQSLWLIWNDQSRQRTNKEGWRGKGGGSRAGRRRVKITSFRKNLFSYNTTQSGNLWIGLKNNEDVGELVLKNLRAINKLKKHYILPNLARPRLTSPDIARPRQTSPDLARPRQTSPIWNCFRNGSSVCKHNIWCALREMLFGTYSICSCRLQPSFCVR